MTPVLHAADPGERQGEMLYRVLGGTGERVSAIGMGGSHVGIAALSERAAIALMHEAIDRGITFLDNCWDYNAGRARFAWARRSRRAAIATVCS